MKRPHTTNHSSLIIHHSSLIISKLILSPDGKSDSNRFCKDRRPRRRMCSLPDRNRQNLGRGTTCREVACNKEPVSAGSCKNTWPADDTKPMPGSDASAIHHACSPGNRPKGPKDPLVEEQEHRHGRLAHRPNQRWKSGSSPRWPECHSFS